MQFGILGGRHPRENTNICSYLQLLASARVEQMSGRHMFISFPEALVARPVLYEVMQEFKVVPNIRRADVDAHSGWVILELTGDTAAIDSAIAHLQELGCICNTMEGDLVEG